jgi:hypothetical protein
LTRTGKYEQEPNGSFYKAAAGTHRGCLTGPSSANFNLYLYKLSGSKWIQVATGTSSTSTEDISYTGTAGYYMWRVISISGSGSFTLRIQRP